MKKLFISFCGKDRALAEEFIEFLQLGMGIEKRDIFCTVYSEMLETGRDFIGKIREQLRECDTVISLITENYLKSTFCMVEMGAAWAMSKNYFPLLTIPYEKLDHTPLQNMEMRKLTSVEDMCVVYDELRACGVIEGFQTAQFHKRVAEFVRTVEEMKKEEYVLKKDEQGYYETVVESVRTLKDKTYRCYGIRGQIADPPDGEKANSDWLFYWANAFPDLHIGDRVRFKTSSSKINVFPDLGKARNIYPDDLKKVE